ncbi:MAG: hypothetical protein IJV04_06760, partial [Lachnospiraceae bacterium]|nr:hypothetical protein [Lachnospiraceae bacterium]
FHFSERIERSSDKVDEDEEEAPADTEAASEVSNSPEAQEDEEDIQEQTETADPEDFVQEDPGEQVETAEPGIESEDFVQEEEPGEQTETADPMDPAQKDEPEAADSGDQGGRLLEQFGALKEKAASEKQGSQTTEEGVGEYHLPIGKIPPGMGKTLTDSEDSVSKYLGVGYNNGFPNSEFTKPTRPLTPLTKEIEVKPQNITIHVKANGEDIVLKGKKEYMFADIFSGIEFDISASHGRQVESTKNGEHCSYTEPIFEGDVLEIYWKER